MLGQQKPQPWQLPAPQQSGAVQPTPAQSGSGSVQPQSQPSFVPYHETAQLQLRPLQYPVVGQQ